MIQPGETVRLKISRNGGTRDLSVKLGELPNSKEGTQNQREGASKESLEGVSIENLDADTAKELGLPVSAKGVVINSIDPSSPKADSGLRKGDVIQEVNHKRFTTSLSFEQAMHKAGKDEALLLVNHGGTTLFIAA
jgi:serine protease Do